MQSTSTIFLIRPANFGFNEETAASNAFQHKQSDIDDVQKLALQEFDDAVKTLREANLDVLVFDDTYSPSKPDAIFPNNWISMHADGTLVLYPMCTPNRRAERREDIVENLQERFEVKNVINLSTYENENRFLEGTGSIVFDHINKLAYACLSPRTDKGLLQNLCKRIGYESVTFHSYDLDGKEIYHTNVMMCIAEKFVVICSESIPYDERDFVLAQLKVNSRKVIEISLKQVNHFAGNMLALKSIEGEDLLVLSQSAFDVLTNEQKERIEKYCRIVQLNIPTIETIGGGSARCMIAEVFTSTK